MRCIQVDAPDGMFLFGRTMLPTHNSTLSAPTGLYMMGADGEQGEECHSAATMEDQARIAVWDPAKKMDER